MTSFPTASIPHDPIVRASSLVATWRTTWGPLDEEPAPISPCYLVYDLLMALGYPEEAISQVLTLEMDSITAPATL